MSIWTLHTYSRSQIPLNCKDSTRNGQVIAQKWLFSPVQRAIPNFSKNRLREVDGRAMPIGKMVWFVILPFGNPKSARGRHPYLRILFPFFVKKFWTPCQNSSKTRRFATHGTSHVALKVHKRPLSH